MFLLRELRKLEIAAKVESRPLSAKTAHQLKRRMSEFADWVGTVGAQEATKGKAEIEALVHSSELWQGFTDLLTSKLIPLQMQGVFISTTFWFCAIVTVQHSSLTRYPDNKGNKPLDIYKKNLPIVRKQPEFMDFLEKALMKFENLVRSILVSMRI